MLEDSSGNPLEKNGNPVDAGDKGNCGCCCPCELMINGYSDGDLTGCSVCDAADAGQTVWDGKFGILDPDDCSSATTGTKYNANHNLDCSGGTDNRPSNWQIDGKDVGFTVPFISYDGSNWVLSITCQAGGGGQDLWQGTKLGTGPLGTYTRTAGCDTTSSLEIVEVP